MTTDSHSAETSYLVEKTTQNYGLPSARKLKEGTQTLRFGLEESRSGMIQRLPIFAESPPKVPQHRCVQDIKVQTLGIFCRKLRISVEHTE